VSQFCDLTHIFTAVVVKSYKHVHHYSVWTICEWTCLFIAVVVEDANVADIILCERILTKAYTGININ